MSQSARETNDRGDVAMKLMAWAKRRGEDSEVDELIRSTLSASRRTGKATNASNSA